MYNFQGVGIDAEDEEEGKEVLCGWAQGGSGVIFILGQN